MRLGKIALFASLAFAAASVMYIFSKGTDHSLSHPTIRAKRSLLKAFVIASKAYNGHMLKNGKASCVKLNNFMSNSEKCIYPNGNGDGHLVGNGHQEDCLYNAFVDNQILPPGSRADLVKTHLHAADAEDNIIPEETVVGWTNGIGNICNHGTPDDMDGAEFMEEADYTQEELWALIEPFVAQEIIPTCEQVANDNTIEMTLQDCEDLALAIEALAATGDFTTGEVSSAK